jgi:hypothetical protein
VEEKRIAVNKERYSYTSAINSPEPKNLTEVSIITRQGRASATEDKGELGLNIGLISQGWKDSHNHDGNWSTLKR